MRRLILCVLGIGMAVCVGCSESQHFFSSKSLETSELRCEARVNPLGIDVVSPRLSWILESDQHGQKQTAYRVLVASDVATLKANEGDLWDSGRVDSDDTFGIVYGGAELTSGTECFWKVQVWDKDGTVSSWSQPAMWSMGLLKPADWKAQWIGLDLPEKKKSNQHEALMEQADWIWADANAGKGAEPGACFFRKSFELPVDRNIKKVDCYVTADDSFDFYVNGYKVYSGQGWERLYSIPLAGRLQGGSNLLAIRATNAGSNANPAGLVLGMQIEFEDDSVFTMTTNNEWKAAKAELPNWQTVDFDDSAWGGASVSAAYASDKPWGKVALNEKLLPPARYLRHSFSTPKKQVQKAYLYTTALGIYQVFINGQCVTNDYFSPGWTDYSKRIYYRTYDVTESINAGSNAIGAVLADGWYAGYIGFARERNHYGKHLRLLSQLQIVYDDGTSQVVASGSDWKASLGPILQADFLQGEIYDARLEMPGWSTASFDDVNWQAVATGSDEVSPKVQAAVSEPVVAFETIKPVSVSEPEPGQFVFDMGQNFAGVVKLKVAGKPGQPIQIRHAERLNPDGTIYTINLRSADATDTYICKGGKETWQPYFTFHGFQYVEVTGLDAKPGLDALVGLALSSDTPTTGTFECSDPVVNKIQQNAVWTQRMNFIDVPTDCPQRDERLGWTGDAQVYINTACYHNDVQAFFTKWLIDLKDSQRKDGQFPTVAPFKVARNDGGPAWADAGVICPWTIYKMYGDKRELESHYNAMKKFIAFCKNRCTDELLPPKKFHCYGDWVNIGDDTPKDVIYMAYFGYSTNLMAQIADALGETNDAAMYRQLFEDIKKSFNKAYVAADGKIKGDSQCAYVLAIAYDLLPDEAAQKKAAEHLVRRVKECDWHLSTGFIGTKDLMLALAKIGRNDVAYRLLHNDTFPSWGFSIKNGATSIWERWDGWTPEKGFQTPTMNSFAHYSFGAVCQWMFENIGGIQTDGAGFKSIILKPCPGGKLTWAKTQYDSVRGPIKTDWKLDGKTFNCTVVIPPNTTATVYVPAASKESVKAAPFGDVQSFDDGCAVLQLESGKYELSSILP